MQDWGSADRIVRFIKNDLFKGDLDPEPAEIFQVMALCESCFSDSFESIMVMDVKKYLGHPGNYSLSKKEFLNGIRTIIDDLNVNDKNNIENWIEDPPNRV